MKTLKYLFAISFTALALATAIAPQAYAADCIVNGNNLGPLSPEDCAAAREAAQSNVTGPAGEGDLAKETAFSFGSCGNRNVGINCLVVEVMRFMSVLVGVAVVGGIIIGGITFSTSEGNPGKAKQGVMIITNSIIGLLLYIMMFAIINFLVPGGILS